MNTPLSPERVLAMSVALAAQHVHGVTASGPTTKKHRGAGPALKNPVPITAENVSFALRWALESATAAIAHADTAPQREPLGNRVPIVLPDGNVIRADPCELNGAALLGAQATCAAELAVLLNLTRVRIERLAALERLRDTVTQVEALDGGDT